jgi:hypothetical protein
VVLKYEQPGRPLSGENDGPLGQFRSKRWVPHSGKRWARAGHSRRIASPMYMPAVTASSEEASAPKARESFEKRFRFLLPSNTLIQFFFGLMIESSSLPSGYPARSQSSLARWMICSLVGVVIGGLSSLRMVNGRWPIGHCNDEEGQRALHRLPSSWDCPAPREIPSREVNATVISPFRLPGSFPGSAGNDDCMHHAVS